MESPKKEWGRRKLLASGMGSLVAVLAGCLDDASEQSARTPTSFPDPQTQARTPTRSSATTPETRSSTQTRTQSSTTTPETRSSTGTRTPSPTDRPTDSLRLPSVAAPGSPGGFVTLRPPGKVVLLDFFATWCAPCKPEMANLRAARDRFSREDVFIVSITTETDQEAIKEFWTDYEGTWPVAMDPNLQASRKYQVRSIPTIIIFTPGGQKVMRHTGLAGKKLIVSNITQALERS